MEDRFLKRGVVFWFIVVFLAALAVRLATVLPQPSLRVMPNFEPVNIAVSLATTGRYADAFGRATGPTAHITPVQPLLLSALFKMFGTGRRGTVAMLILGSVEASLGFALLPLLGNASGLSPPCGALAGLCGALLPINFYSQTNGAFDAPLTGVFLLLLCLLLSRSWATGSFTPSQAARFGVVAGIGALTNPVIIPVILCWAFISAVRFRHSLRTVCAYFGVAALICLTLMFPWALRNHHALGAWIWTRSSFGLELQVSNNDMANPSLRTNIDSHEFKSVHPNQSEAERAKLRRMGEVAYNHNKLRWALLWIRTHLRQFLLLTVHRFMLMWFPAMQRLWQTAFEALLTVLAFVGMARLFLDRSEVTWLFAVILICYPPVYYIVEASPRYRFPLEYFLFLLAAYAVTALPWPTVPNSLQ